MFGDENLEAEVLKSRKYFTLLYELHKVFF